MLWRRSWFTINRRVMKIQNYLNGFKVAYDVFIKRASTYGEINEESFAMYGRVDYGDIEYSVSIVSPEGFTLRYTCPITYDGGIDVEDEGLWNNTLHMWWDKSNLPPTYQESCDVFKAMKAHLVNESRVLIYDEGTQWVVAEIETIEVFRDIYLPRVFKEYPVETWDEVDGMRYKETIYEGHYFVVDGKKYNVTTRTHKK